MAIDRQALRAWVAASCAAQGVEMLVSDAAVVAQVGVLLGRRGAARTPPAGGEHGARRSQSPGGGDAVRVERSRTGRAGADGSKVQNGSHDGGLPGEIQ